MNPIPPLIKIFWNVNFCVSCLTNNWNIWHRSITNGIMENTFIKFSKVQNTPWTNCKCRPLLKFHYHLEGVLSMLETVFHSHIVSAHVIPPFQFALCGGASAIDTLRVINDHILDRWFADLLVCMLFDDVRRAFGAVQHDTLEAILRLLHFPSYLISVLMNAATGATLHMRGKKWNN